MSLNNLKFAGSPLEVILGAPQIALQTPNFSPYMWHSNVLGNVHAFNTIAVLGSCALPCQNYKG